MFQRMRMVLKVVAFRPSRAIPDRAIPDPLSERPEERKAYPFGRRVGSPPRGSRPPRAQGQSNGLHDEGCEKQHCSRDSYPPWTWLTATACSSRYAISSADLAGGRQFRHRQFSPTGGRICRPRHPGAQRHARPRPLLRHQVKFRRHDPSLAFAANLTKLFSPNT